MLRVDVCASDDHDGIQRLEAALAALGGVADDTWHDSALGPGLHRFRFADREVTVFIDAWVVDLAGPADIVNDILAALAGRA